jgi:hypothetical protein
MFDRRTSGDFSLLKYWTAGQNNISRRSCGHLETRLLHFLCFQEKSEMDPKFQFDAACFSCDPLI